LSRAVLAFGFMLFFLSAHADEPCLDQEKDYQVVEDKFQKELTESISRVMRDIYGREGISIWAKNIGVKYSKSSDRLLAIESISVAAGADSQEFGIVISNSLNWCQNSLETSPCVRFRYRSRQEDVYDAIGRLKGWRCVTEMDIEGFRTREIDRSYEIKNKQTQTLVSEHIDFLQLPGLMVHSVFQPISP
jgi:hypothetical protein